MQTLNKLSAYKNVYLLGIGGIGVSALARWFKANGFTVAGYDKTETPLTRSLENEGISISFDEGADAIPSFVKTEKEQTLIIYTPAIPKDHRGYQYLLNNKYLLVKRAKVLGMIAEGHRTIAVAGTHGKTTTSTLIAHILKHSGRAVTAFLGGISKNYHTNLLLSTKPEVETLFVAEADEFDRSFLHLHPDISILTSTDADHLDIYGTDAEIKSTFAQFIEQTRSSGFAIVQDSIKIDLNAEDYTFNRYGSSGNPFYAENIKAERHTFKFDIQTPESKITDAVLQIPGFHNVSNAVAATAACLKVGLSLQEIKQGINSFQGVLRRFDYILSRPDITYIDDYAHHPTEISAFLNSVKTLYPHKRMTVVFQPHLFSRTRDFLESFAESLSMADNLILMPIYPAREQPIPGITSEAILNLCKAPEIQILNHADTLAYLLQNKPELLLTVGAGDIDKLVPLLTEKL